MRRVYALLADRSWLEPEQLAAELGTTTAAAMFAVRELEAAGLASVDTTPVGDIGDIDPRSAEER